ncbi:MAG: usg protein [Bauldia sp.]|nr:usg protein [Bauldia sp.]MCW5718684.1 usg protein [Bauldia sp.]
MLQSQKTVPLEGYGLTTAEILYRIPDHRELLQTFVWQDYDIAPRFPALKKFLDFWAAKLEGPLHSVQIAHHRLLSPAEVRIAAAEYGLN